MATNFSARAPRPARHPGRSVASLAGLALLAAGGSVDGRERSPPAVIDVYEATIPCGGEPLRVRTAEGGALRIEFASGEIRVARERDGGWEIAPAAGEGGAAPRGGPAEAGVEDRAIAVTLEPDRHRVRVRRGDGGETVFGDFGARSGLLSRPRDFALHGERIFVADTGNHRVQVFALDGAPLYSVGLHQLVPREGAGRLHYPSSVAVARDGRRLFVAEPLEGRVQVFRARTAEDPPPDPASTWERADLPAHYGEHWALSGRWLLVAEPDAERVSLYDTEGDGEPIQVAEIGGRPGEKLGEFRDPGAIVFLPGAGPPRAAVLDRGNRRIQTIEIVPVPGTERRFDPRRLRVVGATRVERPLDGLSVDTTGALWGSGAGFAAAIERGGATPRSIPLAAGETLHFAGPSAVVLDRARGVLRTAAGPEGPWTTRELGGARPESVGALADGTLVVTDGIGHRILLVGGGGEIRSFGGPGVGAVQFHHPRAIAVDPEDRIWVLDHGNHRGQVIDRTGRLLRAFGSRTYVEPIRSPRAPAGGAE